MPTDRIRTACSLLIAFAVAGSIEAAEPISGAVTVAAVGGVGITLRELEDAALKKEGAEQIEGWVKANLGQIDWPGLRDDDTLLQIGFNRLSRRELLISMLATKKMGPVLQDLINLKVVEQAVARAGVVLTPEQADRTWRRLKQAKEADLQARSGGSKVTFENWLRMSEGMTQEDFRNQPFFRILASLQVLVADDARRELTEGDLRAWYGAHAGRYVQLAAVHLQIMHFSFASESRTPTTRTRESTLTAARGFHRQIAQGETPWEMLWPLLGRAGDGEAGELGDVGWVPQSGLRADGGRAVPRATMEAAFAVTAFPGLLPPQMNDDGVDLVRVLGQRPARDVRFEDVRNQVLEDRIEVDLEARTQALLNRLVTEAAITRASLPQLVDRRLRTALSESQSDSGGVTRAGPAASP